MAGAGKRRLGPVFRPLARPVPAAVDCVCSGARPWIKLDDLHRQVLDALLLEFGIAGLDEAQRRHLRRWGTAWIRDPIRSSG